MTTSPDARGPLTDVTILDLTWVLSGPFAAMILRDLGADVIKVERPGRGDDTRGWGPPYLKDADGHDTGEAAYYLSCNRGKRSVTIDLASAQGQGLPRAHGDHPHLHVILLLEKRDYDIQ
ncbi:MAG: CoA transferase [Chloroflexi bacterium]|nr:CoA transferase [Chloroflexota bacterium]